MPRLLEDGTTRLLESGITRLLESEGSGPLAIIQHPKDQSVALGAEAIFSVLATGVSNYQWYVNGQRIVGETSSSITVTAGRTDNGSVYYVRVSDGIDELLSNNATLFVDDPTSDNVTEEVEEITECPPLDPYKPNIPTPTNLEDMRFWVQQELKEIERVFQTIKDILECLEDKSEATIIELEDCCLPICDTELVPYETPGTPGVPGCKQYACDALELFWAENAQGNWYWPSVEQVNDGSGFWRADYDGVDDSNNLQQVTTPHQITSPSAPPGTNFPKYCPGPRVIYANTGGGNFINFTNADRSAIYGGDSPGTSTGQTISALLYPALDSGTQTQMWVQFRWRNKSGGSWSNVQLGLGITGAGASNIQVRAEPGNTASNSAWVAVPDGEWLNLTLNGFVEETTPGDFKTTATVYVNGSQVAQATHDFLSSDNRALDHPGAGLTSLGVQEDAYYAHVALGPQADSDFLDQLQEAYERNFEDYEDPDPNCGDEEVAGTAPEVGFVEVPVTPEDGDILKWSAERECWYYARECCESLDLSVLEDCCFPWDLNTASNDPLTGDILQYTGSSFELVQLSFTGAEIDDNKTSLTTAWSSSFISDLLATKVNKAQYSQDIADIYARLDNLAHVFSPFRAELTLTGEIPVATTTTLFTPQPGVVSLSLTGTAPTVTTTGQEIAAVGNGSSVITGLAPTINVGPAIQPDTGSLALTGSAPSIVIAPPVYPGVGSVVLTGREPKVLTGPYPGAGSLTLTGLAPTVV